MAIRVDLDVAVKQYALLLLDTTLLIQEFERKVDVLRKIPRPQRATSLVSVWEFVHKKDGNLIGHADRVKRRDWMDKQEISRAWVKDGTSFENLLWHANCPVGVADYLIAAESLTRKCPLVTRNVKHFDAVPGMIVVPY